MSPPRFAARNRKNGASIMRNHSRHPQEFARRVEALPSRAPLPRARTIHDRTLVVRRADGRASAWSWPLNSAAHPALSRSLSAVLTADEAFAAGLLLAWGLAGTLAHLWLAPIASLA
jgi:hypothetical protein